MSKVLITKGNAKPISVHSKLADHLITNHGYYRVDLQGYPTRMMTAEPIQTPVQYTRSEPIEEAPYGYKKDGTPKKAPGRTPQK